MDGSFPRTKSEALTMLYLENIDLTDKSPTEILTEYEKAYKEISEATGNSKWSY